MIADLFKYVLKSLSKSLTRSSLTILSIMMGIMAIFALLSFGQGLSNYVNEISEDMGTDNIIVQPRGAGPPGSTGTTLTKDDYDFLKKQNGVDDAARYMMDMIEVKRDPDKLGKWVYILGQSTESDEIRFATDAFGSTFEIYSGRNLKSGDVGKVVLGYNYMIPGKIFDKPIELGGKVYISGKKYDVIGFFDTVGNPQDDSNIVTSLEDAEEILGKTNEYAMIYLKTESGYNPENLADVLTERLRKERGLKEGQEDFSITTLQEQLDMFNQIFGVLNGILVLIAGISVLVAAVNIANTMYTAVLERTKEVGIMKAIGARNSYILSVFVVESAILGLIGGIFGIIAGYIVSSTAGYLVAAAGYGFLSPVFPVWLIVGCVMFAAIVGMISGLLPSNQAAKLKPVDALRYE